MNLGLVATAFGLGATIGLLPGPVQILLLTESTRGGVRRGLPAMLGANGTFGILLLAFAAGLSFIAPDPTALRVLKVAGGAFLLYVAGEAMLASVRRAEGERSVVEEEHGRTSLIRGVFAVLLNAGAWVFLATTASALFAAAADQDGRPFAILTAVAMLLGVSVVDGAMVLVGSGVRRFELGAARWLTPILAAGLAAFGAVLVIQGLVG
jgi:threonine/homoserine/homoserine lactone efflux protein